MVVELDDGVIIIFKDGIVVGFFDFFIGVDGIWFVSVVEIIVCDMLILNYFRWFVNMFI